ncbi:MAG: serpin family protein [Phocaeicola sp.]|nr:serpin family protein [Phocaeicola sp.]
MRTFTRFMMAALLLCPFLYSCDSEGEDLIYDGELIERKDIVLTRSEQEMVTNSNAFAFNLFEKVRDDLAEGKSFMISPLSVTYALGMLNNGADGQTKEEICNVLGTDDIESMNAFCRKMIDEAGKLDPSTKLSIANAVEVNKEYKLYDEFIKVVKANYDAEVENLDFSSPSALKHINDWCAKHTNNLIPTILDQLDPTSISVLLNAIYFKGVWTKKFDKKDTKSEKFTLASGKEKKVELMYQEKDFEYGSNGICQILRLPYGNRAYNMTILLPNEGKTTDDIVESIQNENWYTELKLYENKVDVKIPRFKTESDFALQQVLPAMGMPSAFGNNANFSKFCTKPAKISGVIHKTYAEVNEQGTEAAAVTAVMLVGAAGPFTVIPQTIEFHADHPFIYIISELSTNTIFFIGEYNGE